MAGVGQRVSAGRAMITPLAVLNFCMYMIILGIAGWALNRTMDLSPAAGGNVGATAAFATGFGNRATLFLVLFALIAGVTGIASAIAGIVHAGLWRAESLATAAATALVAWLLTLLAFGLACKEIHTSGRDRRLITLESFVIILAGTQLIYLIFLHGIMSTAPATRDPDYAAGTGEPHMKGPGAAAAV
ncbi:hypothetical protein GOP47_0008085 [Adiantum capillus-veneris]|uniref:Uncharacterized protein n=1 Tax=Adiantum capillus-veneris TaxID=13818 RepID=A0A9D4UXK1_ADICA|nr:hypothetical protein GOP47_0008085 [Adiantum capillus-veneris]